MRLGVSQRVIQIVKKGAWNIQHCHDCVLSGQRKLAVCRDKLKKSIHLLQEPLGSSESIICNTMGTFESKPLRTTKKEILL